MDIRSLKISNFRNLGQDYEVEFPPSGLLIAAAPNAVGKTNFLESVVVLLRGKSWRAKMEECVAWGEDSFLLQGELVSGEDELRRVAVRYHKPTRKIRIEEDGVPASLVSFYSHYPFVAFLPEDTFMLSRGPAGRRNFLNHILVANPSYLAALVQLHRSLRQRNAALKTARSAEDIGSWTELLAEQAEVVWRHRENLVDFIGSHLDEMYEQLSGEKIKFNVQLVYGAPRKKEFKKELSEAFGFEQRMKHTVYGPQRDDLAVEVGERSAAAALSRGQQRSVVIALKLIAHKYMKQITEEEPLLLLDDVFSELDEVRQRTLLENLPHTQTVITCTSLPKTLEEREDVYLLDLRSIVESPVKNKSTEELETEDTPEDVQIKTEEKIAV